MVSYFSVRRNSLRYCNEAKPGQRAKLVRFNSHLPHKVKKEKLSRPYGITEFFGCGDGICYDRQESQERTHIRVICRSGLGIAEIEVFVRSVALLLRAGNIPPEAEWIPLRYWSARSILKL